MVGCHDLKKGEVLQCPDCGIELKVIAVCEECDENSCGCEHECEFSCCGVPLVKK
jgi:hypothetical protein